MVPPDDSKRDDVDGPDGGRTGDGLGSRGRGGADDGTGGEAAGASSGGAAGGNDDGAEGGISGGADDGTDDGAADEHDRVDGGGPEAESASVGTLRRILDLFREEDVPFRAASVAYYAIASFVPLLIVTLSALTYVGAEGALIEAIRGSVEGEIADVIEQALAVEQGRGGAGAVGFLAALWSGTKIFRGLSVAFAKVYDREEKLSLLDEVRQGVTVLGFLFVAFGVVLATNVLLAAVPFDVPYAGLVWNGVALLGLVIGLLPLFYVLPPLSVSVRHALPGAVVAAVGWVVLQYGFSIYSQNAGTYAAYGFLGAVLLFVIFLYFAAIVILLGAVVNVALDRAADSSSDASGGDSATG